MWLLPKPRPHRKPPPTQEAPPTSTELLEEEEEGEGEDFDLEGLEGDEDLNLDDLDLNADVSCII